jgi:hypothetical protein
VAVQAVEYEMPKMPLGNCVVVMLSNGITFTVSLCVALCAGLPVSVTLTVNVNVPAVFSVPLIEPLDVSKVTPTGNAPLEIEYV